jgi:hypothetical protein
LSANAAGANTANETSSTTSTNIAECLRLTAMIPSSFS